MDELVRHCLRELSFDGDLGCDVSRLRDFIVDFYLRPSSSGVQGQNVDDAYCAFVWSVIVQQPSVRVGIIPPGGSTEVYIAPQASVIRKAKAKGEPAAEEPAAATGLDVVADATIRSLDDLRTQYGDQLRIAVDPETTFAALTGSHIRSSRLTPMIYTGLQLITRGRDQGISVLDLGKKSGYDQKTCFYIIKQLVDLDLVVKLRQPGISTNIVVHKYFYERSPIWQQVVTEEKKAVSEAQAKDKDHASEDEGDQEETKPLVPVYFDTIDARHLSSMPLLRSRLTKLLKNCPHNMHTSHNLMLKIGFVNPTKTDRKFFRSRLRELMEQKFIERVQVPHANRKQYLDKKVPCIRLITQDAPAQLQEDVIPMEDDDFEEIGASHTEDYAGLKIDVSLHRQMIDCLAEAGTKGMTLNELSVVLGDFDRRTIDLLLNRLEKEPPPAHLADLGIAQLAETHGRERRYKYYTVVNYIALAEKEQFEDRRYQDVDMSAVGGFFPIEGDVFYQDQEDLRRRMKNVIEGRREGITAKGRGKAKQRVNPMLPDGSVKKGRPRKSVVEGDGKNSAPAKKGRKRKRDEADGAEPVAVPVDGTEEPPPKKKRGRPKAKQDGAPEAGPSQVTLTPRKRGPRKGPATVGEAGVPATSASPSTRGQEASQGSTLKEPRVRPPPIEIIREEPWSAFSSPLSSLPPSPRLEVPDASEEASEQVPNILIAAAAKMNDTVLAGATQGEPSQPEVAETASTHLRRSKKTPKAKVRKQGDHLTPTRRSSRSARPSTEALPLVQAPVQTRTSHVRVDEAAAQPPSTVAEVTPGDLPERLSEASRPISPHSNAAPSASEEGPSLPTVNAPLDIAIDPALLQPDSSSLFTHNTSLIAMTPEPDLPQPGPSTSLDISKKRDQPEVPSGVGPSSKRIRIDSNKFRSKGNLTQSRRENEILRLLEEADGILNTSTKEFYEAHAAVAEAITKAGGMASIPTGARIDKRTLDMTLQDLESKGKVMLVTTSVPTLTGSTRLARIAYLPGTSTDVVNAFLADVAESLQTHQVSYAANFARTVEEPLAYGGGKKMAANRVSASATRGAAEEPIKITNMAQLAEMFKRDDETIRNVLLSEKHTVAQLYGYIVGKVARARNLHSVTVELIEKGPYSAHVVSADKRIVHLSYYLTDIPISTYCSLVAVLQPNEELGQLLQTPEGRATPIGSVSQSIRTALVPAHSKSRARIVSLLQMLQMLDLVTPLVPTESTTPAFTCTASPHSQHPTAFDILPPGSYTPAQAPLYWRFTDIAPIRLWVLAHGLPPVWKMVPVTTIEQTAEFWKDLETACTDLIFAQDIFGHAPSSDGDASEQVVTTGKSLRRPFSWSAVYNLSLYQTEYLRQFIDPSTGNTPLQDQTGREEWLDRVSWVVSASKDVVVCWFEKAHKKHLRDLNRVGKRKGKGKRKAITEESEAVIARRAAEAKDQRKREWEEMLSRVHPDELTASAELRVKRVKTRFLGGSGKATEKWEGKIADAIKEANMVAEKLLSTARAPLFPSGLAAKPAVPVPIPVSTSVQEKDVDELIASQGPRVERNATTGQKATRKGKERATDEPKVKTNKPRRHRFIWNRDYDELIRDASVIIKARCRGPTRLEWGAMEQIFPAVPRNSVRQRLVHLKETPGTETYLSRLEDKWYELWVQHRGTDELPDPDPESATNFDLATHVKFLRKRIDKNAIRVGFVEIQTSQKVDLPASLDDMTRDYNVMEKIPTAPLWDFMWNVVAEEAREKQFAHHAFTTEIEDMPPAASYDSEFLSVADAAVRMVLGNPNETYDADTASQLLKALGEEPVRTATTDLMNRGILAKTIRDPSKSKPGRTLKISDSNLNTLGGNLPRELFQDAAALEDVVAQQEAGTAENLQEWPLLATDGDTAFLLELASENKVRFDIDTSHPRSMRASIDWNSKKADDDDIEAAVYVRYLEVVGLHREASVPDPIVGMGSNTGAGGTPGAEIVDESSIPEHGKTASGQPALCRRVSEGLVDCDACLEQARKSLVRELNERDSALAEELLVALREAGSTGLGKEQLLAKFGSTFGALALFSVIQRMSEVSIPLAHWVGYDRIVLVLSAEIRPWTVTVSDAHEIERRFMLFPRRWLDIHGRKLHEVWEAAMRAVLGLVMLHPGISQAEIRWRLRSAYDRQELGEILQTLEEEGYLSPRVDGVHRTFEGGPADECEEKVTFWVLANGGRRWYQV